MHPTNDIAIKLAGEREADNDLIKILVLGAGESGKSTIFKQMKILQSGGFTPEETQAARELIFKNTIQSLQVLISAMELLEIQYASPEVKEKAFKMAVIDGETCALESFVALKDDICEIWADEMVKSCSKRGGEFTLPDSAVYFLDRVPTYFKSDYQPSHQDILRTRVATTGIVELRFQQDEQTMIMFDVGGQQGERKNWIRCFDKITAILFIASLSEYNQVVPEKTTKNRLNDSLDLFRNVCKLRWFHSINSIVLFLNKKDIFAEKVKQYDIADNHPDYKGGLNYDNGVDYITQRYALQCADKELYVHVTNATDTDNISKVWKAINHIVLKKVIMGRMGGGGSGGGLM